MQGGEAEAEVKRSVDGVEWQQNSLVVRAPIRLGACFLGAEAAGTGTKIGASA